MSPSKRHDPAADGWAFPRGGAQRIADVLADDLRAHGGAIETRQHVTTLDGLDWGDPAAGDVLLLDTTPRLALTHPGIPARYAKAIRRYRYGAAAAKVDFALDGPVPWAHPDVAQAPTVERSAIEATATSGPPVAIVPSGAYAVMRAADLLLEEHDDREGEHDQQVLEDVLERRQLRELGHEVDQAHEHDAEEHLHGPRAADQEQQVVDHDRDEEDVERVAPGEELEEALAELARGGMT